MNSDNINNPYDDMNGPVSIPEYGKGLGRPDSEIQSLLKEAKEGASEKTFMGSGFITDEKYNTARIVIVIIVLLILTFLIFVLPTILHNIRKKKPKTP